MRRGRSHSSASPYRALAHQHQTSNASASTDPSSVLRSFHVDTNPARPVRPSPLTASTIRDMPLDLVERIRSFPLFLSAPEEFLIDVGNHLKPQINGPNDHIITEGDDAKAMYWLVRGVVAVTSRDGEAIYAELKPGAFFGEIGVLMDMPRTATIVARTKCLLLVLKQEDLHSVMPKFPEMEKAIREEAQERLNLLKKRRQDRAGASIKPSKSDSLTRTTVPGEVSTGESGAIRDGAVVKSKKRKSPSPGVIEDPVVGSAIGSGYVNVRKTLKELPLFSSLPPEILHFLGLSVQPRTYHPFTDIVRQGSLGNEIFFIVKGEAEVIHGHSQSQEQSKISVPLTIIQPKPRLKAGQYFGEVASLGLSPGRTATVRAITTVECLMITGEVLEELWRRCAPDIKHQVEETARLRLKTQNEEDIGMADTENGPSRPSSNPTTPLTPKSGPLPDLTFTTPSSSGSPSKDDLDVMEPKDPDPFLSVDMENLRNRRRHSIAPPSPSTEGPGGAGRPNGHRPSLIDLSPIRFSTSEAFSDSGGPAKRARTASSRSLSSAASRKVTDQVLLQIFTHLDIKQLIRLRLVSRHWRHLLSTSPDVCNDVDLSMYNRYVTDHSIVHVLAPFIGSRATSIDLNNCFHVTDEGFSALWRQCGRNIKRWRMRSVWDVSAHQILEMSENAKRLEELDWSNCRKVGDNLLARVVGWVVAESPVAKKGAVVSQRRRDEARQAARNATSHQHQHQHQHQHPPPGTVIGCPKLSKLDLSYCKHITDRSMAHLAAHASDRLVSLSLTRCTSISDVGFQSWAQYRFEKLTHLCLADCTYLSDNAVVALVNAAKSLTHLDLSFCCALSDTSTEVVALGLPMLRELRMAFCGSAVSDASLESIALHLNDLEGLSVRGCVRVTGKGLEDILRGCTRLKWADVSQCRNLEHWLRAGSIAKWGFDDRADESSVPAAEWMATAAAAHEGMGDMPPPKTMSVAMLTTPSFLPRSGLGFLSRRAKQPVRFIIEKGLQGLR